MHHIYDFAHYPDYRLEDWNGITLCENCHKSSVPGSLHQLYGTQGVTPQILQTFINEKRQSLGIEIPFDLKEFVEQNGGNLLND